MTRDKFDEKFSMFLNNVDDGILYFALLLVDMIISHRIIKKTFDNENHVKILLSITGLHCLVTEDNLMKRFPYF